MLSDKIRPLLKEVGINLTFSVSASRSLPKFGSVPSADIGNALLTGNLGTQQINFLSAATCDGLT